MKAVQFFSIVAGFISLVSCSDIDWVRVKNPITISSPSPTEQITKVSLTDTQAGYVEAGNKMSFRFLKELYDEENLVCSPGCLTVNTPSGDRHTLSLHDALPILFSAKSSICIGNDSQWCQWRYSSGDY